MPTFNQLSDYYAKYIRNKLVESIFEMINYSTKSKDRQIKLAIVLMATLKEINKNLNQYNLSDVEKNNIINKISNNLGLANTNLLFMFKEASNNNFPEFANYLNNFFEELELSRFFDNWTF
jgi:hypothetical protein